MTRLAPTIGTGAVPEAARGLLAAASLPTSDLTDEQLTTFFYCGYAAAPSALIGVEIYGSDALLRSLVVDPSHRSTGLGSALVERAEGHAATPRCGHAVSSDDHGGNVLRSSRLSQNRPHRSTGVNPINARVCRPLPGKLCVHVQTTLALRKVDPQ